ncbi:hypothetical protein M0802_016732 [Mischocyttarus mexicanus]|nr:hypothetical protein M0802_016732 [Mischocyttarus mexicanus]
MNTRSKSDKPNIEELYSQATRNPGKPENLTQPHTSSPYSRMSRQQSSPVDLDISNTSLDDTITEANNTVLQSEYKNSIIAGPAEGYHKLRKINEMADQLTILKYAIKGISMFDGKNIPLKDFIRQCNAAKEMIPEGSEIIFIKMLKSRLIGDAYDTIDTGEDIKTIDQLLNPLVAAFGERNSNGELMRKLAETSQDPTETVHSFSIRMKKIGLDIIQNYKTRNHGEVPDLILRTVEEDVRNQFLRGLRKDIEIRVPRGLTLKQTLDSAVELERSLGLSPSARRSQFESILDRTPPSIPSTTPMPQPAVRASGPADDYVTLRDRPLPKYKNIPGDQNETTFQHTINNKILTSNSSVKPKIENLDNHSSVENANSKEVKLKQYFQEASKTSDAVLNITTFANKNLLPFPRGDHYRNPVELLQTTCHVVHGQRNLVNNPVKILELLNESEDDMEDRTHDYYRDDIPDLSELKDDERMVVENTAALLTPKNPIKKLIANPKPAEPNRIDGWKDNHTGNLSCDTFYFQINYSNTADRLTKP